MTNATEQIKNPNEDYNALKKTYFQLSMFAILLNFAQRNNLSEFCRVEAEAQVYESLGEASELILKARSRALLSKVNEILPSDGMPIAKERSKLMHPPKNYLLPSPF